VIVKKKYDRI